MSMFVRSFLCTLEGKWRIVCSQVDVTTNHVVLACYGTNIACLQKVTVECELVVEDYPPLCCAPQQGVLQL